MIPDDIKEKLKKKYSLEEPTPLKPEERPKLPVNETEYPESTDFEIRPYIGASNLLLGMTPAEVQSVLKFNPRKGRSFDYATREYHLKENYQCCFVHYKNPSNTCNFVEFYSNVSVKFKGKNLLNIPYIEAEEFVKGYDTDIDINGVGFISYKYGFGVYAEFAFEDVLRPVETVCVFEKGYYDN